MKTIKDACDEANYYTPIFLVINGCKLFSYFNNFSN